MNRHEAREAALGLVFEKAFKPLEETDKLYELAKLERELEEDEYFRRVTNGVFENLERIDSLIEASAKGWKINRMPKVSLALMRICVYELIFEADIPTNVSLNEAVELAKKYDGDDAPAFVNGVLNKIAKELPEKL
ncbi:MAG: transcription antitermination factor NusB [Clostridia bacterium]|nr:transcription antitermination factor NusB [Clostridia bacterium]